MRSRLLVGVGLIVAAGATGVGAWLLAMHRPRAIVDKTATNAPPLAIRSGDVLFIGDEGDLHAVQPDGTTERTLATQWAVDVPSLSPDGLAIAGGCAGHGYNDAGGWNACYARPDGSAFTIFGPGSPRALWSPDASRFVYTCCNSGASALYEVPRDGSASKRIATLTGSASSLAWDAGSRFVFVEERFRAFTGPWHWELEKIDVRTGTSTVLLAREAIILQLALSPDGSHLAFVDTTGTVQVADLTSGDVVAVQLPQPFSFGQEPIVWSPDGARFAYVGHARDPRGVYQAPSALLVTTASTFDTKLVAKYESSIAGAVTWSPRGAFVSAAWQLANGAKMAIYRTDDYSQVTTIDYGEGQALERLTWSADESHAFLTGLGVPLGELAAQNHLYRVSSPGWAIEQISSSFARSVVGVVP